MWLQLKVSCWDMVTVLSCVGGIFPAWFFSAALPFSRESMIRPHHCAMRPNVFWIHNLLYVYIVYTCVYNRTLKAMLLKVFYRNHYLRTLCILKCGLDVWCFTTEENMPWFWWLQQVTGRHCEGVLKWINAGSLSISQVSGFCNFYVRGFQQKHAFSSSS